MLPNGNNTLFFKIYSPAAAPLYLFSQTDDFYQLFHFIKNKTVKPKIYERTTAIYLYNKYINI